MNQDNLALGEIDEMNNSDIYQFSTVNLSDDNIFDPLADSDIECQYYNELSFSSHFQNYSDPILFSLNTRSLLCNYSSLVELLNANIQTPIHFIALQEVWQIPDSGPVQIPGFKFVYKQRSGGRRGGGVGLYIRNFYDFRVLENISIFEQSIFESLVVEVSIPKSRNKIILANFYRPNNHDFYTQSEQMNLFLDIFSTFLGNLASLLLLIPI